MRRSEKILAAYFAYTSVLALALNLRTENRVQALALSSPEWLEPRLVNSPS